MIEIQLYWERQGYSSSGNSCDHESHDNKYFMEIDYLSPDV